MSFNYPATELFTAAGERRVVWSTEEYEAALAEGMTDQPPVEPTVALLQEQPQEAPAVPAKRKRSKE